MFADPIKILKQFRLSENMIVADVGAGSGFYSVPAAQMVPQGKVYAIEIQKDFLKTIKHKADDARLGNIDLIWGDVEQIGGTKIKEEVIDAVIASNIFFQIGNKGKFLQEVFRILKKGGKVLLVDWSDSAPLSPKPEVLVPKEKARELFEQHGFIFERDIDAGAHHYGMIFNKQQ